MSLRQAVAMLGQSRLDFKKFNGTHNSVCFLYGGGA